MSFVSCILYATGTWSGSGCGTAQERDQAQTSPRPVIEYPTANVANPASTGGPRVSAEGAQAEGGEAFNVAGGDELVQDGGFEAGSPNPSWSEGSTNFGSPLCGVAGCGVGGGTGPHSGTWWVWFGGTQSAEDGFVEQSVTIPSGSAELAFWLRFLRRYRVRTGRN